MNQAEFTKYILTLDPALQKVCLACDLYCKESVDTLGDEYQIASEILEIFAEYAERFHSD